MRQNATYKPLIFCVTVPVQSDWTLQNSNLSLFNENIRKNYGVQNYVWVREYTGGGRPHYHYVADSPFLDAPKISAYWNSLYDAPLRNSVRLGTKPIPGKPRKYFVDSDRMSRYLTKYMGKSIGEEERRSVVSDAAILKKIRTFGMSQEVASKSKPVTYEAQVTRHFTKRVTMWGEEVDVLDSIERQFTLCENSEKELIEVYGSIPDHLKEFDDTKYAWFNPNPLHRIYYGVPKRMQKAGRHISENSQ